MKGEDLLEAMNEVDPALLQKAQGTYKQKKRWWPVGLAVAACLAALTVAGVYYLTQKDSGTVVYASEIDYFELYKGVPKEKIDFVSDFSAYQDDDQLRILIMFYDQNLVYPDIYNQTFNGMTITEMIEASEQSDMTSESLSKTMTEASIKVHEEMKEKDLAWLKSLGAKDIDSTNGAYTLCTMKKKNVARLAEYGGRLRVAMAQKETEADITKILSQVYGTYRLDEQVFVSMASSVMWTDEMLEKYKRTVLTLTAEEFGYENKTKKNPAYHIEYNDRLQNGPGVESFELYFMNDEMIQFFSNGYYTISVDSNYYPTIYCNENQIFVDAGRTEGIFRLVKQTSEMQ